LCAKAVSIVGFFGLARTSELVGLTWADIVDQPDGSIIVHIKRKKCAKDAARDPVVIPACKGHRAVPR